MTDTELLDAMHKDGRWPREITLVRYFKEDAWEWYDRRGTAEHPGWTQARDLRDALSQLLTAKQEPTWPKDNNS